MPNKQAGTTLDRRSFICTMPGLAAVMASATSMAGCSESGGSLTAGEVRDYLLSLGREWVDKEETVDTFKSGGPDDPVRGIAVAWMSYTSALEKAVELGCNLFVTHEPTYYNHRDNDPEIFRFPEVRAKRELIENNGLTVLRCHDVWDRVPEIGIPMAWGSLLGLGEPLEGEGYFYVYDGGGRRAVELARQIASRVKDLGQPGVQLMGEADRKVGRVALGTGAITPMFRFIEELGADMAICTDDGFTYWRDGAFAVDTGFPVAVVNHPVSEERGMELLAGRLRRRYPDTPVHHIPQKAMYRLITA